MQIVSSYGVEIKKKNIPLRSTLDIFRKAVSYLIGVYAENWEELSKLTKAEILKENLQDVRIIHNNNWQQEIRDLLEVA